MRTSTFFYCLLALFLLASGCASTPTLPDVKGVVNETPTDGPPKIVTARGQLSPKRSREVIRKLEEEAGPTDILKKQIKLIEEISGTKLVSGNKATLLIDGPATYAAMFKAIRDARDSINLETFIFDDDETGQKFADLLLTKRAEGVQVNIIYDSVGSVGTPAAFFQRLRDGGVLALEFNPVNPLKVRRKWRINHRDHRKILVVDGRIAFTGGINISSVYTSRPSPGSPKSKKENAENPWRDTHVMIEGPAVAEFQKLFMETWKWQHGPPLPDKTYFPTLNNEGDDLIMVIGSRRGEKNRLTYIMYYSAFVSAERHIHLTNSYFVPDDDTVDALTEAARRGIDVKVILPGESDVLTAFYAGRSYYKELLKAGVKLYELKGGILHAKTAVVDGVWSTVGSTNMDMWSFASNNEVNAVILGNDFAGEMETMFEDDLKESKEVTLEQWKKRPLFDRVRDRVARLLRRWL